MISEVDVAKKCYQIWHKVAKVPKKCYQMWQNVAKGVPRGFKGFQGVPRGSEGKWYQMWQKNTKWVKRESATRCGKKLPKGFQKVVQLYLLRRTGSKGPRRRRLAQGPKGPELVIYVLMNCELGLHQAHR